MSTVQALTELSHRADEVAAFCRETGEPIQVTAVCTPVQLGRLKDYVVSGWTPPRRFWPGGITRWK